MAEIVLDSVSKAYPGSDRAVADVTLTIRDGEFLVLVGPSGCGKSTLLRLIAGLEELDDGRVLIAGRDMATVPPQRRDVAMVFQNYALYPHMSVRENLAYSLKIARVPKRQARERVESVARMLGLEEFLDRKPGALSGGQRQRTAMGRAIVREPHAFLMDEPLSNLDAKLRVSMRASLAQLHARLSTTSVYVTHDQTEAMTLGQRVAVMRDGTLQQVDTPRALYDEPANLFVAAFIGSPPMNFVDARLDGDAVEFGSFRLPLSRTARPPVPTGRPVVLGIRPQELTRTDAEDARAGVEGEVVVVEEHGADADVVLALEAPPFSAPARGIIGDRDEDILSDDRARFVARIESRATVRPGDRIRLTVDPARFHFFDCETGERLRAA